MASLNAAVVDYLNFELIVGLGNGREYEVSVRSPAGEARELMRFPYDKLALENKLKDLQIALLHSGGKRRRIPSPHEQAVQSFGLDLFNALIANEVRTRYDVSQGIATREDKGLRLILRIQEPKMAALPWEFLYDPRKGEYVCLSRSTPIVRYPESPQPVQPLWVKPPLHILGMAVSPFDLNPLDIDQEKQRVEEAVKRLGGLVALTWLEGQTWQDLQEAMQGGPWHIFHFIGHGGFNQLRDEGFIALADENGHAFELSATNLARLLDHRQLKLVLLNACEGARGGDIDIFSSTASILVRSGIPAVLAMQYEITDTAAIEFSRSFYRAVAQGMPLEAAVVEARKAISIAVSNTVEWGTPVLYLRSTDGRLFNVNLREEQVNIIYGEARAAMAEENWSLAIVKLKTVLEQVPTHEEAQNALRLAEDERKLLQFYAEGRNYYKEGRWDEARISFESAQTIDQKFRDVSNLLSKVREKINEEQATELYAEAAVAAEKEDLEEAIKLLVEASALNPGDKRIEDRLNLIKERKEVAEIYAKGKELYDAGNWADALISFEQVKARIHNYKDVEALANEAAENANRELQEQIRRSNLINLRGRVERAISQEDWPGAALLLQELLDLGQSDAEIEAKLTYVQQQMHLHGLYIEAHKHISNGSWEEALKLLRQVSNIDPGYKDVAAQITETEQKKQVAAINSGALTDIEMARWDDAEKKLQKLLALDPASRTLYLDLLNTVEQNKKLKRLYAKGLAHYRKKRWRYAYEAFQKVQEINGDYENVKTLIEQARHELKGEDGETKKGIPRRRFLFAVLFITAIIVSAWFVYTPIRKLISTKTTREVVNPHQVKPSEKENVATTNTPVPPPGMVYVAGGECLIGRNNGDKFEFPEHMVSVKHFFIDIYEVTCEEYQKFIKATGHNAPPQWVNNNYPYGAARKPVTGVTWDDANSYAKWAGKHLPTEEQWECAARGTDGRLYPWGNEWKAGLANADFVSNGMAEVGTYKGTSPFGAYDMVGNAWEWTLSEMKAYPGGKLPRQPLPGEKVIRGGIYKSDRNVATTTYRRGWRATGELDYSNMGFRLVRDID